MSAGHFTHYAFVDFENVPEVDLGLVEGKPVHVTLFIGKHQKKLDLALVRQIHRLATQVELVEVGASGRNALDLTLAYYLGQAVQRAPDAQFHIVSKDKDFEPLLSHLHGKHIKAARCGDFHLLPFLEQRKTVVPAKSVAATLKKPPEDRRAKVITRLKDPANRQRPGTQKRLLAHIKTALGKEVSEAKVEDILRELVEAHALIIDANGKVSYAESLAER